MAEEWGPLESTRTVFFEWKDAPESGERYLSSNSLSGGERNRIYFRRGGNFSDYSLISGADFREDGRGFALLDFDRDGWLDLGVSSPNHPRFRIVRNMIGDQPDQKHQSVELKLVGGQTSSEFTTRWSPRDAFGARVLVSIGDQKRMFHLSCGEGLSGVNAKRIHIGMGTMPEIDQLEIFWPSGLKTTEKRVRAGQRLTVYENPELQSVNN